MPPNTQAGDSRKLNFTPAVTCLSHRSVRDRPFLPSAHRNDATARPPGCERLDSRHACKPWSCERTVRRLVPPHNCGGQFDRRQFAFCLRAGGWTNRRSIPFRPTAGGEEDLCSCATTSTTPSWPSKPRPEFSPIRFLVSGSPFVGRFPILPSAFRS